MYARPKFYSAGIITVLSCNYPQKSTLSSTIVAGYGKTLSFAHMEGEVPIHNIVPVALCHIVNYNHVIGAVSGLREAEAHRLEVGRNHNRLNFLKSLNAALDLSCLCGLVSEALYELLCSVNLRLLAFPGGLKLFNLKSALFLIGAVVSAVACEISVEKLIDLINRVIQKGPVMADNQKRTAVGLQKAAKPDSGLKVKVVGRLIKHHHIRTLCKDFCKGNAHLKAA